MKRFITTTAIALALALPTAGNASTTTAMQIIDFKTGSGGPSEPPCNAFLLENGRWFGVEGEGNGPNVGPRWTAVMALYGSPLKVFVQTGAETMACQIPLQNAIIQIPVARGISSFQP